MEDPNAQKRIDDLSDLINRIQESNKKQAVSVESCRGCAFGIEWPTVATCLLLLTS